MRTTLSSALFISFLLTTLGCAALRNAESRTGNQNAARACSLITSAEMEAVLGEPYRETRGNDRGGGGVSVSHCVYVLPTYSKSVSLDVTRNDLSSGSKDGIQKFWETRFRRATADEDEHEKEREEAEERGEHGTPGQEREEEEAAKPRAVSGVGDEAFWVGNGRKGSLYVLSKDAVVIISLGGGEDESVKIKKSAVLAQQALKRL
jgi:hypothetical protein